MIAALVLLLFGLPASVAAAPPFGPKEYLRASEAPITAIEHFAVCRLDGPFRLRVENGPGGRSRVSSGTIALNGSEVVGPQDFNQQVTTIERVVTLRRENTLAVWLAGAPGGALAVSVLGDPGCLEIVVTSPPSGATVPAGSLVVQGTVRGAADAGVTVNRMPAFVEGEVFVALVRVDTTAAELLAVAAAPGGATAEFRQALVVTPAPQRVVRLRAARAGGVAPLTTRFYLSSVVPVTDIALDAEGDGTVDFRGASVDDQEFTYPTPGVYAPTARVADRDGGSHTATALVHVYDRAALDVRLQAVWRGLTDALRAGDVPRALTFVHSDSRDRYGQLFRELQQRSPAALANIDQDMTAIEFVEAGLGGARYEMVRSEGDKTAVFPVWFQIDLDGLWRLRRY